MVNSFNFDLRHCDVFQATGVLNVGISHLALRISFACPDWRPYSNTFTVSFYPERRWQCALSLPQGTMMAPERVLADTTWNTNIDPVFSGENGQ